MKSYISDQWVQENKDLAQLEQTQKVQFFLQNINKHNPDTEFRILKRITETQFHMENLDFNNQNLRLNRFIDILPWKYCQIKIKTQLYQCQFHQSNSHSQSYKQHDIIATQGPLYSTIFTFWEMVQQYSSKLIIMLCSTKQNKNVMCQQYWPISIGQTMQFKNRKITFESEKKIFPSLISRTFKLQSNETQFTLEQLHYTNWTDKSSPPKEEDIIVHKIIHKLNQHIKENPIIHCSAGIGRTGTIISLLNIIQEIEEHGSFSIFSTVRKLREQRWGMVSTSLQYNYLYQYIERYLKN